MIADITLSAVLIAFLTRVRYDIAIGVARGAVGAPAPPRAVKKFFSGVIYRENV